MTTNKTYKANQLSRENVTNSNHNAVEFRPADPANLADNPQRLWVNTQEGAVKYSVDGITKVELSKKSDVAANAASIASLSSSMALKVDKVTGKGLSTNDYDNTEKSKVATVSNKADKTYVDIQIASVASGSPKGTYATITDLQAAFPTGNTSIYLVTADGKWYYWNGSAWTAGGTYQSTGVGVSAVGKVELKDKAVSAEKTDFLGKTINLFNPRTTTKGQYLHPDTGVVVLSDAYSLSDFIDVEPNTDYYIPATHNFHRFDANGNWINSTTNATGVRNSLAAVKVKIGFLNSGIYNTMMVKGTSLPSFVENGFITGLSKNQYQLKDRADLEGKCLDSYLQNQTAPFDKVDLLSQSTFTFNNRLIVNDEYEIRYKNKRKSYKVDLMTSVANLLITPSSSLALEGVSEFILVVYLEDVSKLTNVQLKVTGTSWSRPPVETLVNGWNVLRYQASTSDISVWTSAASVSFDFTFNAQTTAYISDVYAIKPNKAKILFINDHGYHNFKQVAYPQLKALGIPITWAINPGRLGTSVSSVESILTQADIDELAYDPYSEFSIHNWNPTGNPTSTMTADQLLADTHKCLTYIRKNGVLPRYPWRAAFTQNDAPQHAVLQPYLDAYGSYKSNGGIELYPFRDKYNVNRVAIHGASRDNAYYDTTFDTLKKTRSLFVCYCHGLDDAGDIHITNAQLTYFLSKISTGVSEGWLEGTTYSKLRGQYKFSTYSEIL